MFISPFSPIFFTREKSDGVESPYIQTFADTDKILVEIFCSIDEDAPICSLYNCDLNREFAIYTKSWQINDNSILYFVVLTGLNNGNYQMLISNYNAESYPFRVTDDSEELQTTTLLQYSMSDNRQRMDAIFLIDGMRYFFDFRVPGGFKDSDTTFACESESYSTQDGDICQLYARESTQKKFTLGYQEGVPARFAELLNRLLCCNFVYFDGVRYARKDSAVPEINVQLEGVDSFVYKQSLQKVAHLNPTIENENCIALRREGSKYLKLSNSDNLRTLKI